MADSIERDERRRVLEQRLRDVVQSLREQSAEGNLTVQVPETGDFVAILHVDREEARDLEALLRGH